MTEGFPTPETGDELVIALTPAQLGMVLALIVALILLFKARRAD